MFRVRWIPAALNQLTTIWINATDQNAVTAASHAIDLALAQDPDHQGESRPPKERVMYVSPLGIRFRVNHRTRTVRVLACWQIRSV